MDNPHTPAASNVHLIEAALRTLRLSVSQSEPSLHAAIAAALDKAQLPYVHEAPIAPRRRIDFLCLGVGVEIKRGKPARGALLRQLGAYAQSPQVGALLVVTERAVRLPGLIGGKPCRCLSLHACWGIALPTA